MAEQVPSQGASNVDLELMGLRAVYTAVAAQLAQVNEDFPDLASVPWYPLNVLVRPFSEVCEELTPDGAWAELPYVDHAGGLLVWLNPGAAAVVTQQPLATLGSGEGFARLVRFFNAFAMINTRAWQPVARLRTTVQAVAPGQDHTVNGRWKPDTQMVTIDLQLDPDHGEGLWLKVALPWSAIAPHAKLLRRLGRTGSTRGTDVLPDPGDLDLKNPETMLEVGRAVPLTLELGADLLPLVDPNAGGDMMERLVPLRYRIYSETGFVVPGVRIRDNLDLDDHSYQIRVKDHVVLTGKLNPGYRLALTGPITPPLQGVPHPRGTFVTGPELTRATLAGIVVVDPTDLILESLASVIEAHAGQILALEEARLMLDKLGERSPSTVSELVPERLRLDAVHRVFQVLLRGGMSLHNLGDIVEQLTLLSRTTEDPYELAEWVRVALPRDATTRLVREGAIATIALSATAARHLANAVRVDPLGPGLTLRPVETRLFEASLDRALAAAGEPAAILCDANLRPALQAWLARVRPGVWALAARDVPVGVQLLTKATASWPSLFVRLRADWEARRPVPRTLTPVAHSDEPRGTAIWDERMETQRPLDVVSPLVFLEALSVEQVVDALLQETPAVAAGVLGAVDPGYADSVLQAMSPEMQEKLINLLQVQPPLTLPRQDEIARSLKQRLA